MARDLATTIAQVRKAIINLLGLAAGLLALGLVHDKATLVIINSVIAVLTVIVHYRVPNASPGDTGLNAPVTGGQFSDDEDESPLPQI